MSDSKLTALTAETTVAMTDITYFVDDPGGTPLSRKCTIANLSKGIDLSNVPTASGAVTLQPASGSSVNVSLGTTGDFIVNTNQFVVDTSASLVCIGTTTGVGKLTVSGAAGTPAQLLTLNGTSTEFLYAAINNTGASLWYGCEGSSAGNLFASSLSYASLLGTSNSTAMQIGTNGSIRITVTPDGAVGFGLTAPTAIAHLKAGTATASTAPLKFTTGTVLTTPEAGCMEYNNTPHFTNSDATRRSIVLASTATKTTAGAPYTNDGYITVNIGGTDVKVMTTA